MNIESVITSIKLIKNIYGKMDQRQVRHIIVSFANYEGVTCDDVDWIQSAAVDFYRQLGYQAISAIHVPIDKDDKIHFHMAVNTVNLYDGSKYSGTYTQSQELFNYLKGLREGGLNWEIKHKYVESLEEELSLI